MNNQEILDNAPEGATLYAEFIQSNLNTYAQKWGGEFRFWDAELNEWAFEGWWLQSSAKANFRSLADIERITELEKQTVESFLNSGFALPKRSKSDFYAPAYNEAVQDMIAKLKEYINKDG